MSERLFYTYKDKEKLLKITNGKCAHCGKKLTPQECTIEHMYPISRGGTAHPLNIVPLCVACNKSKTDSIYDDTYYEYLDKRYSDAFNMALQLFFYFNTNSIYEWKDCVYLRILSPIGEKLYSQIRKRSGKRTSIKELPHINLKLEKAYYREQDEQAILNYVRCMAPKGFFDSEVCAYYNNIYHIREAIDKGVIYLLRNSSEEVIGLFILEPVENFPINDIPQCELIENASRFKRQYVMTLASIKRGYDRAYEYVMGNFCTYQLLIGSLPMFFNIQTYVNACEEGDPLGQFAAFPHKWNDIDGYFEFYTLDTIRKILDECMYENAPLTQNDVLYGTDKSIANLLSTTLKQWNLNANELKLHPKSTYEKLITDTP